MGSLWKFKGREVKRLSADAKSQETALREARERIEHPKPCSRGLAIKTEAALSPQKKAVFIQKVFAAVGEATHCMDASGKFTDQFLCAIKDGSREPGMVQNDFSPEDEIARQKLTLVMRYLQSPQIDSAEHRGLTMLFFCFHEDLADMELTLLQIKIKIVALQEDVTIDCEELRFEGMQPGEHIAVEESPAAKMAREEQEAARALEEAKRSITTLEAAADGLFIDIDPATPLSTAQDFIMAIMAEAGRITKSITADGQKTPRWFATCASNFTSCSISCFNQGLANQEARLLQIRIKMIAARLGINITRMDFKKGPEGRPTGMMIVGQIKLGERTIIVKVRLGFPSGGSGISESLINFSVNPRILLAVIRARMLESIAADDLERGSQIHFLSLAFDATADTTDVEVLSVDPVNDQMEEQIFVTFQSIDDPKAKA